MVFKATQLAYAAEAKDIGLNIRHITALKLYTDFDELQREFKICFRDEDETDREIRQRQFFWWNSLLEAACSKSPHKIAEKLYTGIKNQSMSSSTFSGTFYGMCICPFTPLCIH